MINVLLSGIFVLFAGGMFSISFCYQGLNRAVINTPIEVMFRTVEVENHSIHFDKNLFEESLLNYYDNTLPRYSKSHTVSFYYYNVEDESMCIENLCDAVEVTVNCKLIFNNDYSRTMSYRIRRN